MRNSKRIGIVFLTLILLGAVGVFIFHKQIIAHFIWVVEQTGEIHIEVRNDTSYVSTSLVIKNRTSLKIKMDTIKYKVSLFDKIYLQNEKFLGVELPGHGNDTINFSIKIPHTLLIRDLKAERTIEDSASYAVNVFLQYSTPFWTSEMPINKEGRLKIPQPPELKVEEINWKKIRLKSLSADVKIKITNHSLVALSIKSVDYSMNVTDHGSLKGNYSKEIDIKPKGVTFINVPIEIKTNRIGKTLFQVMVDKDKYNYTLILKALIESTEPEKKVFYLDLTKTGKMELKK